MKIDAPLVGSPLFLAESEGRGVKRYMSGSLRKELATGQVDLGFHATTPAGRGMGASDEFSFGPIRTEGDAQKDK
jgi:hypothetical protein